MKKLGALVKQTSEKIIKGNIKDSESVFVIKYSGTSSPDLSALRLSLKDFGGKVFVVKNSVARRALKDAGVENLIKTVEGPCGLVFADKEPVGISRILYNFSREHQSLKIEGGVLNERFLENIGSSVFPSIHMHYVGKSLQKAKR